MGNTKSHQTDTVIERPIRPTHCVDMVTIVSAPVTEKKLLITDTWTRFLRVDLLEILHRRRNDFSLHKIVHNRERIRQVPRKFFWDCLEHQSSLRSVHTAWVYSRLGIFVLRVVDTVHSPMLTEGGFGVSV